ncbi:MAG TPA: hypothetical protein VIK04_19870 [Solirubrobacteraceae bacterium]
MTIHAYSPPLRRTGAYRVGDDGALERESLNFEVELCGEAAAADAPRGAAADRSRGHCAVIG